MTDKTGGPAFAKLFETEEFGQILVTRDENDDGRPAIIFAVMPQGLGICKVVASFEDSNAGWGKRDRKFHEIDGDTARKAAASIFKSTDGFAAEADAMLAAREAK